MPITADNPYYLTDALNVTYRSSTTKIFCTWATDKDDVTRVNLEVWNSAGDEFYGSETVQFTEAELEAFTGTGTGEFTIFKSCVEQAVVDYLDGRAGNTGVVTFTIV